uniref:SMC hinge domain-containing protein n=1 Tax=Salix viminalis TaxID=40686 RepID=A0A6N2NBK4_SALVM
MFVCENCVAGGADISSKNCVAGDQEIGSENCISAEADIGSENCVAADADIVSVADADIGIETASRPIRISAGHITKYRFLTAGSYLENIVFEVVDSQGDVDLRIHNEEKAVSFLDYSWQGHVDDIEKYDELIGNSERQLKVLNEEKTEIEEYVSGLQASMEPTSNNSNCVLTKEEILVQIESRNHSAAAILCQCYRSLLLREPQNHLTEGIFGLVALLGTVGTSKLSRILAELLGEDQMLAVVCRSKETASAFAQSILSALHTELECGDPQRKLKLSDPTLQSGNVHQVSLDGGMIRVIENGIMSLGCWDSEICFPVGTLENEMNLAPERMKIKMQLEAGMEMLQSIKGKIQHATRLREKAIKKLKKKMSKNYNELMDQVEAVESRK